MTLRSTCIVVLEVRLPTAPGQLPGVAPRTAGEGRAAVIAEAARTMTRFLVSVTTVYEEKLQLIACSVSQEEEEIRELGEETCTVASPRPEMDHAQDGAQRRPAW